MKSRIAGNELINTHHTKGDCGDVRKAPFSASHGFNWETS
jgi:hypothetical protein